MCVHMRTRPYMRAGMLEEEKIFYLCACALSHVCVYMRTHLLVYIYARRYAWTGEKNLRVHVYSDISLCICALIYMCMYVRAGMLERENTFYVCTCALSHMCVYMHTHPHVYAYACRYAWRGENIHLIPPCPPEISRSRRQWVARCIFLEFFFPFKKKNISLVIFRSMSSWCLHIWMSVVTMSHVSCHTYKWVTVSDPEIEIHGWVTSHVWKLHGMHTHTHTHTYTPPQLPKPRQILTWVSHVTNMAHM